ncbi:MAG TPA: Pr6Pr family membrane protein [Bacillota bacterium]|nr:Pr6Pr family membrane protein [Bacillota bacterium]
MEQSLALRKRIASVVLKLGVAASCCMGILSHHGIGSGNFIYSIYKAFTIQSNLWISGLCLIFLSFELTENGQRRIPQGLHLLKFMFTSSILLTWGVFAVLLSPTMTTAYLLSQSNFFLHNLTPVLALLDYLNFDADSRVQSRQIPLSLVMPLLYAVFFCISYAITGKLPVPYFFLDYKKYGWYRITRKGIGIIYWIVFLSFGLLGIGAAMLKLKALHKKNPFTVSLVSVAVMLGISALIGWISGLLLHKTDTKTAVSS